MANWAKLCTLIAISFGLASTFRLVYCGGGQSYSVHSRYEDIVQSESIEESSTNRRVSAHQDQVSGNPDNLLTDEVENEDIDTEDQDSTLLPVSPEVHLLKNKTQKSSLLLVSTLDGTISALDADNDGAVVWQMETGPGGLLSSSISKVELNSNGKLVRLIPSLDGGLYKFDGDSIEPIPISADSLLHSSFRAADDLLITGGKEVRTYGIDARTGRLQYLCTAGGCHVEPAEAGSSGEFLILRRHSQVVRAIEPRTGTERWNFSVGRHEASLLYTEAETFAQCQANDVQAPEDPMECLLKSTVDKALPADPFIESAKPRMEFKVIVPDGLVCAVHPKRTSRVLWKYKFESPVVQVWQLVDGRLIPIDLFSADFIPALEEKPVHHGENRALASPLLYVGIHNRQLYVQESPRMVDRVAIASRPTNIPSDKPSVTANRLQWKPVEATALAVSYGGGKPGRFTVSSPNMEVSNDSSDKESTGSGSDPEITALIVRHQTDYPFDRGFYLFERKKPEIPLENSANDEENSSRFDEDEELWEGGRDTPVHIVIVSLWFWWREVVLISLLTAFSFHMIITRQVVFVLQRRWAIELQRHLGAMVPSLAARLAALEEDRGQGEANMLDPPSPRVEDVIQHETELPMESGLVQPTEVIVPSTPPYVSRYLTDFEPIQCLGRGGFGLVFEVRNRLDDCHYAVKRIQLPRTEESREKVMREVKALAKLDNPHIVRYFHAWIECPPPGWQEAQDAAWIDCENLTGPTPYNSGEEVSISKAHSSSSSEEDSEVDGFRISKALESIDNVYKRNRFSTEDSSFDIVFEDSEKKSRRSLSMDGEDEEESSPTGIHTSSVLSDCGASNDSVGSRKPPGGMVAKHSKKSAKLGQNASGHTVSDAKMFLFIQMQLCRKESLREWLRTHVSHRDTYQVLHMYNEIVRAVEYVHLQGLIHRDLKPSNIFFAPDGAIKIGDFGLVTAMAEEAYYQAPMSPDGSYAGLGPSPYQRTHTDQVGTQMYMSPEQIEGKPYNYKVDIYSLGLIFVELLWPLATQMEQVTVISQLRKLRFPAGFSDKYPSENTLLRKMLSRNPDERPTTYGIRASPTLINYQDSTILDIPEYLHYNLSRPRSTTRTSSTSSS